MAAPSAGAAGRPSPPSPRQDRPDGELPPWGVQVYALDDPAVERLADLGAGWLRLPVSWAAIEPENTTPQSFRWEATDELLGRAAASGLTPILTVGGNPAWAAASPGGPITSTMLGELGQFLGALAARYGAPPYGVKYWELYNEPDNGNAEQYAWLGGAWGHYGSQYAEMLAVAAPALRAADPAARVVLGGLAHDWFTSEGGIFVESFLGDVLQAGGAQYLDVVGFHYYPFYDYRWGSLVNKAKHMRAILARYGAGDKPLWVSEAGWFSNADVRRGQGSSDATQSSYVVKLNVQAAQAGVDVLIWFALVDWPQEYDGRMWGLLRADLTPKPSYAAFQTLARELAGVRYVRSLTADELGTDGVEGHVFALAGGGSEKTVLWAAAGQERSVRLPAGEVRVVDMFGTARTVLDRADGQADGYVTLAVTEDPAYVSTAR